MPQNRSRRSRNCILSHLGTPDFRLIESDLEAVDLPLRKMLDRRQRRIDFAYFPESGIASVVANGSGKKPIEVGIIGREGMTALAVLLGDNRPDHETYMQFAGQGQRLKASALRKALDQARPCTVRCSAMSILSSIKRRAQSLRMGAARSRNAWRAGCSWPMIVSTAVSCL